MLLRLALLQRKLKLREEEALLVQWQNRELLFLVLERIIYLIFCVLVLPNDLHRIVVQVQLLRLLQHPALHCGAAGDGNAEDSVPT